MSGPIVIVGSPTALGGHFGGMDRTPAELRRLGLVDRLRERPGLADTTVVDRGDASNDPGWAPDDDPRAKNRARICAYLPRLATHVASALAGSSPDARVLALGGDCTTHAGVLAGIRRARSGARLGLAWFDAHGDFNTPDTTPSGNVWGMPFAMICGRGEPDLRRRPATGPPSARRTPRCSAARSSTRRSRGCSRPPGSPTSGRGCSPPTAARPRWPAWVRSVAGRVDGFYVAFDVDALDASGGWSVAMPEPDGLALETALVGRPGDRGRRPRRRLRGDGSDVRRGR